MRRAAVVVLPLIVVFALAVWQARGPEPKGPGAPPGEFSSARALGTLRGLLAGGEPHPTGSPANDRMRDRILTQFGALGYETKVQSRFSCNAAAVCGAVENILASRPGARDTDVVLLVAHYDSVPASPGASDDGTGVATLLEVARALRGQTLRNPVAFLVTDGEEAGLLGAEAFMADESLSRGVAVVINVEMRGTYGQSNMFETSSGNRWLIAHLARSLDRPQATSLFYAVYSLMPNDSDVTIFKRGGKAAVNFAGIRGVNWYHTPLDDLAHTSARTLQHHGDNVLGTARALANADLAARSRTDATFFDVLNFFLVWWPQEWTLWMAIVSLILLLFAVRRSPPRELTFGVLTAFAAILMAGLLGTALAYLTRVRSDGVNFAAHPEAGIAAMWLSGIAAALWSASLLRRRAQPLPMLYGVAIVWHMIGIALAIALPGAAFLLIVPAVCVTLCALSRAGQTATSAVAGTVGAALVFPMGLLLYDALGGRLVMAVAVLIGLLSTLVAPLFPSPRAATLAAILATMLAGVSALRAPYDVQRPRWISLAHVDDPEAASPQWVTGKLTPQLQSAARFSPADAALTPWRGGRSWSAPAPRVAQRVSLSGTRDGGRLVLRVRSFRGAGRLNLLLHGDAKVLRVNGVAPPPPAPRFRTRLPAGWQMATAQGVEEMVVEVSAQGPIEVVASDTTYGLPAAGAVLAEARRASTAIPVQDGDTTITRARAKF